jgi:hypothetical protein
VYTEEEECYTPVQIFLPELGLYVREKAIILYRRGVITSPRKASKGTNTNKYIDRHAECGEPYIIER